MTDNSVLLSDFETFKENFSRAIKEDNVADQVEMTKKLGSLAKHLGEKITRTQLLPFLKENKYLHDETLLNLSEQLKILISLIGGYEHSQPIFDILKTICGTDETVVRQKTIEAIRCIADDLNDELTEQLLLPVLEGLAGEEWFTYKCSAIALFPIIYPKVKKERQDELRHNFRLLAQDDFPIVRKAAALSLMDLIPLLDKESVINEFISVFDNISNDNIDSVQLNSVKLAITFCSRLTDIEIEENIFKTLEKFAESSSWKIHQTLAANIADIQRAIPFPKLRGKILAMFQNLMKHTEDEVRIAAVKNLVPYCRSLKDSYDKQNNVANNFEHVFVQSIVPQIALVVVDISVDVKLAFAKNVLSLSTVISKEVFMEQIVPMVIDILELDASVPVKANILENLNDLPHDVYFAHSLPSIKKVVRTLIVYSQSHWRTRKGLLVAFMHIARFTNEEYFSENLKIFYASLLGDPVFAVRRTAPIILPLLATRYGMTWTSEQIIPYFKMFTKDSRYLYRYVPLFGINELLNPSVGSDDEIDFLGSLKTCLDQRTAGKMLYRLTRLVSKLESTLEGDTFVNILSLNESIDDFKTDNLFLYAEDTLTTIKSNYGRSIYSYEPEKSKNPDDWYMTGLVVLICREFLGLLLTLFEDRTVNVQIRSVYTLNKIKLFVEKVSGEISEPWVKAAIGALSKDELHDIEMEVDTILNEKSTEVDEDQIDTDLMENMFTPSNIHESKPNLSVENDESMPDNSSIKDNLIDNSNASHNNDVHIDDNKIENDSEEDSNCNNNAAIEETLIPSHDTQEVDQRSTDVADIASKVTE